MKRQKVDTLEWLPERMSEDYIAVICYRYPDGSEQVTMKGNFSFISLNIIITNLNNRSFRLTAYPLYNKGEYGNTRIDIIVTDIEGTLMLLHWALSSLPSAERPAVTCKW